MKVKLKLYSNVEYKPGKNALVRTLWFFMNALVFESSWFPFYGLKRFLLRFFGASVGKDVVIKPNVSIKYPWRLSIGDYSWIGEKVWIDNLADVYIGNNCCISQGSMLLCGNHNYKKETFDLITGEIRLNDGVWVGAQSTVCPGVQIGENAVLCVGSVTSTNLDADGIYRGNPATLVRNRI